MKFFQTSSTSADPVSSLEKLNEAIENATKREVQVQRKIDTAVTQAQRKLRFGDKRGALFCMKQKKLYEKEMDKLSNVKMTLETQVIQLESASSNRGMFSAMQSGNAAMTKLRQAFGLEKVDKLMDDMKDEMEMADEINNAVGTPLDPYMEDDDELLAELEMVTGMKVSNSPSMFSWPTFNKPNKASAARAEKNDLKRLEAQLAA